MCIRDSSQTELFLFQSDKKKHCHTQKHKSQMNQQGEGDGLVAGKGGGVAEVNNKNTNK